MSADTPQVVFEQYLRGERSLTDAADAVTDAIMQAKRDGRPMPKLRIEKPKELAPAYLTRAEAFFDEMNRRGGT